VRPVIRRQAVPQGRYLASRIQIRNHPLDRPALGGRFTAVPYLAVKGQYIIKNLGIIGTGFVARENIKRLMRNGAAS
jgi:hypothetical protein